MKMSPTPSADAHSAFAEARRAYDFALANLNKARKALRGGAHRQSIPWEGPVSSASLSECSFPPHTNFSNWPHADVKLPTPWCPAESRPPPAISLPQLALEGRTGNTPVLPSLLVPCCAHSGTTFLWRCMLYAFHPQRVCGRRSCSRGNPSYAGSAQEWTNSACGGRRYLLPGLTGNIEGHWDYRKEWFFYGGGGGSWAKGWGEYVGVDLPLCYWEPEFQRLLRAQPLDDTLAHSRRLCQPAAGGDGGGGSSSSSGGGGSGGSSGGSSGGDAAKASPSTSSPRCTHRACMTLDLDKVRLSPTYAPEYDRRYKPRWQFQASKALPRVRPGVHTGAVVSDMTPNYLCSPKSLRNLAGSIGAPKHFRFLVLHRRPLDMINASYKMFIQWGWVRTPDLESDVKAQLASLETCNRTLYAQPELLRNLPAEEALTYFGRCWRGVWRDFVANSMPYVCLRAWMATGFEAHQFMLVPQAQLRTARAAQLLPALSNFTGLHYNAEVLQDKQAELNVHCEAPPSAKRAAAAAAAASEHSPKGAAHAGERHNGSRRRMRGGGRGGAAAGSVSTVDPADSRPLVNSHAGYTGRDAVRRTRLSDATHAELTRLAKAHTSLLEGLGVSSLSSVAR